MDESNKPSLLERLSALLMREPEDREQLLKLLHSAFERNLLDGDALSMIEGALQVSEMQVRDIMVPRSQMDMIDVSETPDKFIPQVIATAHSRFPVIDKRWMKDLADIAGVVVALTLIRWQRLVFVTAPIAGAVWLMGSLELLVRRIVQP